MSGMLVYDNSNSTLEKKIEMACGEYIRTYEALPTLCYVSPSLLPEGQRRMGGLMVKSARSVLPTHIWLGVEGERP